MRQVFAFAAALAIVAIAPACERDNGGNEDGAADEDVEELLRDWTAANLEGFEYDGPCDEADQKAETTDVLCHIELSPLGDDARYDLAVPFSDHFVARLVLSRRVTDRLHVAGAEVLGDIPAPEDPAPPSEALGEFLRAWWAGDEQAMGEHATEQARATFQEPAAEWYGYQLRADRQECGSTQARATTCAFTLMSEQGGGFSYEAHFRHDGPEAVVIESFEALGGGA